MRPTLEVADIFRRHGDTFRAVQGDRLSHAQRRVMAAIEACRTAMLGGHVERCEDQGLARAQWLADRRADLLPVPYFHLVFTMPMPIAAIALQNKALVYDILFTAAADAIRMIAADPKHLGAETGMIAILHTWGQTLTHHPHIHCLVPGGGLASDGSWVGCRPGFFLPVRVLSRLYRHLFLEHLQAAFDAGDLKFFGDLAPLSESAAFAEHGRYTHRVAIANSRLLACENGQVRFRWKDYRAQNKSKPMTLDAGEFIRRFLLHVLPKNFRRIRHFGFLANACRAAKLPRIRAVLGAREQPKTVEPSDYRERYAALTGHRLDICPICGGRMIDIGQWPRSSPFPHTTPHCDSS